MTDRPTDEVEAVVRAIDALALDRTDWSSEYIAQTAIDAYRAAQEQESDPDNLEIPGRTGKRYTATLSEPERRTREVAAFKRGVRFHQTTNAPMPSDDNIREKLRHLAEEDE
jgi:predicted transcriptional regulator